MLTYLFVLLLALPIVAVCLRRPVISYYLLIAILPYEGFQFGSTLVTPIRLLGAFALGLWAIDVSMGRHRLSNTPILDPVSAPIIIFFAVIIVSAFRLSNTEVSIAIVLNYFSFFVLFFLTLYYIRGVDDLKILFAVFAGSFSLMTILSGIEHVGLVRFSDLLPLRNDMRLGGSRFVGYMRSPNHYSLLGIFASAGALCLITSASTKAIRGRWTAILAVCIAGVLMSYSRTGLAGLTVMAIVYLAVLLRKKRLASVIVSTALILLASITISVSTKLGVYDAEYAATRYSVEYAMEDPSTRHRLDIFGTVWNVYLNSPVIGVGLGGLAGEETESGQSASNAHNLYLAVAAQFGTLGLVILGIIVFRLIRRHIFLMRHLSALQNSGLQSFNAVYLAMAVAVLAFGLAHDISSTKMFYLTLAISPVLYRAYATAVLGQDKVQSR